VWSGINGFELVDICCVLAFFWQQSVGRMFVHYIAFMLLKAFAALRCLRHQELTLAGSAPGRAVLAPRCGAFTSFVSLSDRHRRAVLARL